MGYLDQFRIIEKTNLSERKKYMPQVRVCTMEQQTGRLWWKRFEEVEIWNGFYLKEDGLLMIDSGGSMSLVFEREGLARECIEQFKKDMKTRYQLINDNTYRKETKIIEVK